MNFLTSSLSKIGGRPSNQDFISYSQNGHSAIWVIADGMGGHRGGEHASALASEAALEYFLSANQVSEQNMLSLLQYANMRVRSGQKEIPDCDSMQTTICIALSNKDTTILSNIGDSRGYYFSEGKICKQTKDHSIPQLLVNNGEILQTDIRYHEDRNKVLRSIGKDDQITPDILLFEEPLKTGDALLLCTDGFWELVLESEMEIDLIKSMTPEDWLRRMEMRLLKRMTSQHDNYSAIAVYYL